MWSRRWATDYSSAAYEAKSIDFFFQTEDGIRDVAVTGVHTCAFFFSSRRRHTRSDRDWSSDVCSSDRSEEHTSELQSQAEDGIRDLIVTGVQTCALPIDRKSTRLNSSHDQISYAVFCLEFRRVLFRSIGRAHV